MDEENDKHIETILRQMLKKIEIKESGDSNLLPGEIIDRVKFNDLNEKLKSENKNPAKGERVLMGITKASLQTESFISAASFQETTRVLTDAAIKGKVDKLVGLKRLKKYVGNETFMMTYGDGLSNVNLKKLLKFHKKNKKLVTLTAVRPPARFGALKLKGHNVNYFKEKSQLDEGWINGGFFVMEPKFLKFIKNDDTYLEREPLEQMTKKRQLMAFKHKGFWQCMDTKRDKDKLDKILKSKKFKF